MVELRLTQPPLGVLCYPWYTSLVRGWFFETEILRAVLAAVRFPFPGERRYGTAHFSRSGQQPSRECEGKRDSKIATCCLPFVPLKSWFLVMVMCFLSFKNKAYFTLGLDF